MQEEVDSRFREVSLSDRKSLYKFKNLHGKGLFCHGVMLGKGAIEIRRSKFRPYFKNSGLIEIRGPPEGKLYATLAAPFGMRLSEKRIGEEGRPSAILSRL